MRIIVALEARQAVAGEVRAAIARRGVTAKDVAENTGIAPSTLSGRLAARAPFTTDELNAISVYLGTHASEFFPRSRQAVA
ncbi:MAG: helix-turn-helix transcriptional regulator [Patescibacteria group bacterium]|nr:helix-turn-helix transcriptional regulator [Patescibacteria group bacterium]